MCPTCKTTLDQSSAPIANRIRAFISARIVAGDTKSEIKREARRPVRPGDPRRAVQEGVQPARVGAAVPRARPGRRRARVARVALVAPRPRRSPRPGRRSTPSSTAGWTRSLLASTLSQLPVAFVVGFVSIVTPCVLPLVPGYLSAVSAVEARPARRAGDRGAGGARRASRSSSGSRSSSSCSAPARRRSGASSRSARRTRSPGSS